MIMTPDQNIHEYAITVNNQKPRDVFGHYRGGLLEAVIPERQKLQNDSCQACQKLFEEFDKDTTDEGFEFFVTLDHVLQSRGQCQFCRFLFESLCLEDNDPMKAKAVAEHVQNDIGNSLARWATPPAPPLEARVARIPIPGPSAPRRKPKLVWPFGYGDPKATLSEAVEFNQGPGRQALISALSYLRPRTENYKDTTAKSIPLPLWIIIQCLGRSHVDHGVLDVDVYGFCRGSNTLMTRLSNFPLRSTSSIDRNAPDGNLRYGHRLDKRIDLTYCRQWVHHCGERHGDECNMPTWSWRIREPLFPIRFIDVMEERITHLDNCNFKYIALSYVNGDFLGTTLVKSNMNRLMEPQGLREGKIAPGQTLLDAMEVTKALGIRYLWVDRLCILHEDDEDMEKQILQMDAIYGRAFATIVAADGKSAHSGLAGVSKDREVSDLSVQVKENLGFVAPVKKVTSSEPWERRAWTYQEMLLSKRLLIFNGGQVYFQCRQGILLESMNANDAKSTIGPFERLDLGVGQPSPNSTVLQAPDGSFRPMLPPDFEIYSHLVAQYTKRSMSLPADGVRAIMGLLNVLEPNPESIIFGLPKRFMDLALMWQPAAGIDVRLQRRPNFPSWSWAGWEAVSGSEGGVRYEKAYRVFTYDSGALRKVKPRDGEAEMRLQPLIDWERSLASESGKKPAQARSLLQRVISPDRQSGSQPSRPPPPPPPLSAPISPTSPSTIPQHIAALPLQIPIKKRPIVPPRPTTVKKIGENSNSSKIPCGGDVPNQPKDVPVRIRSTNGDGFHNNHLQFKTETAFFTLGTASKPRKEIFWAQCEGHLVQDSIEAIHEIPILQGEVEVGRVILHDPENGPPGNVHEFAKISEAQYFGDEDRVDVDGYPLLNVMLIKRDDSDGWATRAGLGRIYKKAWKTARLTTEVLILG